MIAKLRFLLFVPLMILLGCREDTSHKGTYITGLIVNPKTNYVVLFKNEQMLDTVVLDANNFFSYQFKQENPSGIYTFTHPPESQVFYIEKGDSLLFRLNTFEFDESLEYSGDGGKENNFLMEMFLLNEKNNSLIFEYFKTSPKKFAQKADSIKTKREKRLSKLDQHTSFSKHFIILAKKAINYEYYDLKERYSFLINKYLRQYREKMPKGFLSYRKKVNFNDIELQSDYIYQRFLDNYLRNRSIDYCITHNSNKECYSLTSLENLTRRLVIADSLFKLPKLRNQFLERFSRKAVLFAENDTEIDSVIRLMKSLKKKPKILQELQNLAEIQRNNIVGQNISSRKVLSTDLNIVKLGRSIYRTTLVFMWSIHDTKKQKFQHSLIQQLRKRYPRINFIGINIDQDETLLWLQTIKNLEYDPEFEFQIQGLSKEMTLLYRNYTSKVLFVDKNGKIIDGKLRLGDAKLEQQLLELLNR